MTEKRLPAQCPSCNGRLKVRRLACPECDTAVEGCFELPVLSRLAPDEQEFVLNLLRSSGSLKDLAKVYGVSYPTVRNRLDAVIDKVWMLERGSGGDDDGNPDDSKSGG